MSSEKCSESFDPETFSNVSKDSTPKDTIDCVSDWSDLDPNMFKIMKQSQAFGEDEEQNKGIVEFMLGGKFERKI